MAITGGSNSPLKKPQIIYRITREDVAEGLLITRNGACPELARDDGDFSICLRKI